MQKIVQITAITLVISANTGYAWEWPTWQKIKAMFTVEKELPKMPSTKAFTIRTSEGDIQVNVTYPRKPTVWEKMKERAARQRYLQGYGYLKKPEVKIPVEVNPTIEVTDPRGRKSFILGGTSRQLIEKPGAFSGEAKQQFYRTQSTE